MEKNKTYVTFSHEDMISNKVTRYAVECEDRDKALEVAMDASSIIAFKNVRINSCGRFANSTKVFGYDKYKEFLGC